MKRKAFLAKVLAAAVAVTSVLPSGLVAEAAPIIETSGTPVTMAESRRGDWSADFTSVNVGGEQTWRFMSGLEDGNTHTDLTNDDAPAAVYASDIDIKQQDSDTIQRQMSFELYPNKDTEADMEGTRFGIFLKYVDSTNWAFLGYEDAEVAGQHWWIEYKTTSGTGYPDVAFKNSEGTTTNYVLKPKTYTHINVKYVSAGEIEVSLTPLDENKAEITAEKLTATIGGDENETVKTALEELRTYANTEGAVKPIYFGFKGGTYSGNKTDMNIGVVKSNVYSDTGEMEPLSYGQCGWEWVRDYGDADADPVRVHKEPGENDPNEADYDEHQPVFLRGDVVGGTDYANLIAEDGAAATNYLTNVTDFSKGTVSAIMRPYIPQLTSGNARAFYLGARYTAGAEGEADTAVQVGWSGSRWEYKIGANAAVEIPGDNLPTPQVMSD